MTPSEMSKCQTSACPMSKHQQRYLRKKMAHSNLLSTKKENEEKNIRLMKEVSEREYFVKCLQQVIQNHRCPFDAQTGMCSFTNSEMDTSSGQICSKGLASSTLSIDHSRFPFLNNVPNVPFPETTRVSDLTHEDHSHLDSRSTTCYTGFMNNAAQHLDSNCPQSFPSGFQRKNLQEHTDIVDLNAPLPFDVETFMNISDDVFSKASSRDQSFSLNAYIREGDLEGAFESFEYGTSAVDLLHSNDIMFVEGC